MSQLNAPEKTQLPQDLLEAIKRNELAIFIGAGASRIIGCKGWDDLAEHLIERCQALGIINYRQKSRLLDSRDFKKIITICKNLMVIKGNEEDFYKMIESACSVNSEKFEQLNIYRELKRIPALFLTTNYDEHFDRLFSPDRIIFEPKDFSPDKIDREKLYHIHGSIRNRETLVLTVQDYLGRYNEHIFSTFLQYIYENYTVLFIGYGLSEFEVLDFLVSKARKNGKTDKRHYILQAYFLGENDIAKFEEYYFGEMQIQIIPFAYDKNGYDDLYSVIKSWADEIETIPAIVHGKLKEIDEVVSD